MSPLHFDYSNLRQVLLQSVVIVCFGIGVGLMFNFPMLMKIMKEGAPKGERIVSATVAPRSPRTVVLEEVEQLQGKTLRIDARIPELYAEGHLPGAVSLPYAEVDGLLDSFKARVAKDESMIIYCSGYGCPDSFDLSLLLLAEGYQDVGVFEGGYPQWRDAGKPIETDLP
jgi:rhodanese-related sulfurtransferase